MAGGSVPEQARELPREPTADWIRVLAVAAVLVWLAVVAWQLVVLPERVPTHFDGSGQADGWSSKAGALGFSFLLPLVCVLPLPFLSRLALYWPQTINGPNRDWWIATPRRLVRFERLMREDLWIISVLTLALLVSIQVGIALTAMDGSDTMSSVFTFGALGVFTVALVLALVRMYAGGRYAEQPELG